VDERISIKQAPAKSAPPRPHPHPKEKAQKVLLPPVRHNGHEWPPIQQCNYFFFFFKSIHGDAEI